MRGGSANGTRAGDLLRSRATWVKPTLVAAVLVGLMSLIYFGYTVDPAGHMSGLPVVVVDQDAGGVSPRGQVDYGRELTGALTSTRAITDRLSVKVVSLSEAEQRFDRGAAYVGVVIPPDFTRSVLALDGVAPASTGAVPALQLRTNNRAGSTGVALATGVLKPALEQFSTTIGKQLTAGPVAARSTPSVRAMLADPVTIATVVYRPLPSNSSLGLSAFFIALITTLCGFMAGMTVNTVVDGSLGYATNEVGPRWSYRRPRFITRWQTLLAKYVMAASIVPLLCAIMLAVAVGVVGVDAPHVIQLWVLVSLAAITITIGTLTLYAALGALGQLIALLVFIYLALASSGGSIPLHALPGFFRFVSAFEPLRQLVGGVRAILYFDARADAGLARAYLMSGTGLVLWALIGFAVTTWYDRKHWYRLPPEIIDSLDQYEEQIAQQLRHRPDPPG